DRMRLCGRYKSLAHRFRTKGRVLQDRSAARAIPEGPDLAAALEWYFERRLGLRIPRSVESYAWMAGWPDHRAFLLAIWRDYLFEALGQCPLLARGAPDFGCSRTMPPVSPSPKSS